MTGWIVYFDDKHIYFTGNIEQAPLWVPFEVDERIFSSEEEMMEFVDFLDKRG